MQRQRLPRSTSQEGLPEPNPNLLFLYSVSNLFTLRPYSNRRASTYYLSVLRALRLDRCLTHQSLCLALHPVYKQTEERWSSNRPPLQVMIKVHRQRNAQKFFGMSFLAHHAVLRHIINPLHQVWPSPITTEAPSCTGDNLNPEAHSIELSVHSLETLQNMGRTMLDRKHGQERQEHQALDRDKDLQSTARYRVLT